MNAGIYKITNVLNNLCYVGQTKDLKNREMRHFSNLKKNKHDNSYLQNTYNKYGKEIFKFEIIQELEPNKELLNLMEIYWIAYFNSFKEDGGGYNLTRGGDSTFHTEETKRKISLATKGRIFTEEERKSFKKSEETRKRMSESLKNRPPISEETRLKMSLAKKGKTFSEEKRARLRKLRKPISEETREKLSIAGKGRVASEESKERMCIAQKKAWETRDRNFSDDAKHNMSVARSGSGNVMFGKTHSEEARKKMADSKIGKPSKIKGIPKSENHRKKLSESAKKRVLSEETKKKISDSCKIACKASWAKRKQQKLQQSEGDIIV